jgi:molybdenum cofactor cytidylyltransferase
VTIGVLLLAGGFSRRFGSDKRMAGFRNRQSLLEASVTSVQRAGLPLLVALRGTDADLAAFLAARGVDTVHCPGSTLGMGHTLAEGLAGRPASWTGVIIALGDMPLIRPETFRLLRDRVGPGLIAVPEFEGKRGHPVAFDAHYFNQLLQLTGDQGASGILALHEASVVRVPVDDGGIVLDIDSPAQLTSLKHR